MPYVSCSSFRRSLALAAGLTSIALSANAGSLAAAFAHCDRISDYPLARDLIKLVFTQPPWPQFEARYRKVARTPTLKSAAAMPDNVATASVELIKPPKVAGLTPVRMTATTCTDGCGFAIWTLDFGRLAERDVRRLKVWVDKAAPVAIDTEDQSYRPLSAFTGTDGVTRLICDLSS